MSSEIDNVNDLYNTVASMYEEGGTTGLNHSAGYVMEEFLPNLRYPQAAKVYKEMADNDATVGAILYMAEMLVRKSKWSVSPGGPTPADDAAAKFVEECMNDMQMSWASTISEILSMFTYGFSVHEIVYKIRRGPMEKDSMYKSNYTDGLIGWKKLPIRSQDTIDEWDIADNGTIKGFVQNAPPNYVQTYIPLSKALLFRTKTYKDNPEGKSLLRNAYRASHFKKRIEEIEGIGIERDLAGLPYISVPEELNIWDKDNLEAQKALAVATGIVRNIRRDRSEGVVLPNNFELKLLSTGGARQFDTSIIINRWDQRIAITLLSDIVMLGADKVGSFALADAKKSLMSAALEAQLQNIAEIFNKYAIPKLIEVNSATFSGITNYPTLVPDEIEAPTLEELSKAMTQWKIDIYDDYKTYSFIRSLSSLPHVTEEEFNKIKADRSTKLTQSMQQQPNTNNNKLNTETSSNQPPNDEDREKTEA